MIDVVFKDREKQRTYQKIYHLQHKDELHAKNAIWRANNKNHHREYYLKNKDRIKEKERIWRIKNQDKINTRRKLWREKNHQLYRIWELKYYQKNKERINARRRVYEQKNKERINARRRVYWGKWSKIWRAKVVAHYSNNTNKCMKCGISVAEFLTIDHINGGGREHRKQHRGQICRWLISHNFPSGYQILCFNCNCVKGFFGEERLNELLGITNEIKNRH